MLKIIMLGKIGIIMYDRIVILPYKMLSSSARELQKGLLRYMPNNVIRVYPDRNYRYKEKDLIINWGSSKLPNWGREDHPFINHPYQVQKTISKIDTYDILIANNIPTVEYTTYFDIAKQWLEEESCIVLGRSLNRGSGGRGIVVYNPSSYTELEEHIFYTKYIKKMREFRVHLFKSNFLIQEKKRRGREERDFTLYDPYIRSYGNEWVYTTPQEEIPSKVLLVAEEALKALELTFGGVDVIYNEHYGEAYVLEVNTACGLGQGNNQTLDFYCNNILTFRDGVE